MGNLSQSCLNFKSVVSPSPSERRNSLENGKLQNPLKNMWIDSHAHIDKLNKSPREVLEKARQAGVFRVLTIGTEWEDWKKVVSFSEEYAPQVYGALGMHPHTAKDFDKKCETFLRQHLSLKRIVAVGEIGLDYFYKNSDIQKQKEVFERQMSLACSFDLPVEIHTREAEKDTVFFLKKFKTQTRGLLHCFTGSYDLAKRALDCGFNISFSGILTFKKADSLREICKKIPLDRLHIETDSPFLSPEPYRGKENQPAFVSILAQLVADLHKVDLQKLSDQLKKNTWDLFPKMKKEEDFWINRH